MKELGQVEAAQSGCRVVFTKACSSSRTTIMAANQRDEFGIVMDLTRRGPGG